MATKKPAATPVKKPAAKKAAEPKTSSRTATKAAVKALEKPLPKAKGVPTLLALSRTDDLNKKGKVPPAIKLPVKKAAPVKATPAKPAVKKPAAKKAPPKKAPAKRNTAAEAAVEVSADLKKEIDLSKFQFPIGINSPLDLVKWMGVAGLDTTKLLDKLSDEQRTAAIKAAEYVPPAPVAQVPTSAKKAAPGFRLVPLVPISDDQTLAINSLCDKISVNVVTDHGEMTVNTGFLFFNRSLDLITLSNNVDWINGGLITPVDQVHPDINLAAIKIEINGEPKIITVQTVDHPFVTRPGSPSNIKYLDSTILYRHEGRSIIIKIGGEVDIINGRAYFTASVGVDFVVIRGVMLNAHRHVRV